MVGRETWMVTCLYGSIWRLASGNIGVLLFQLALKWIVHHRDSACLIKSFSLKGP